MATLVDTRDALKAYLDELSLHDRPHPLLYVDLEGNDLSRNGTLSLVTILDEIQHVTKLIDVTVLGSDAFTTPSSQGQTLKDILESSSIVKVFFDIRNDSDALFALHRISVQGIEDLQLMELATRTYSKRCINGLAKCIAGASAIGDSERQSWRRTKDNGRALFNPAHGGSFQVFDKRPLDPEIQEYCTQDVAFMPRLRQMYRQKLCTAWWEKIMAETEARVRLSQTSSFNGQGRHMALGPKAWANWNPSAAQRSDRSFLELAEPESQQQPSDAATSSSEAASSQAATSSEATTSSLGRDGGSFSIVEALTRSMHLSPSDDSDDDVYESRFGYGYGRESPDDHEGDLKDFAACDKECGYCGRCDY